MKHEREKLESMSSASGITNIAINKEGVPKYFNYHRNANSFAMKSSNFLIKYNLPIHHWDRKKKKE